MVEVKSRVGPEQVLTASGLPGLEFQHCPVTDHRCIRHLSQSDQQCQKRKEETGGHQRPLPVLRESHLTRILAGVAEGNNKTALQYLWSCLFSFVSEILILLWSMVDASHKLIRSQGRGRSQIRIPGETSMLLRFAAFVVCLIAFVVSLQAQEPSTERRPIRLDDLFEIWVLSTVTREARPSLRQITTNPGSDTNPAWSADGKYLFLLRLSPFNYVEKIVTPTLIMGGEKDWNVPILNSEQLYQALKRLGREMLLVVYPGESHGIRRPTFLKDRRLRALDWYDKYVKGWQPEATEN